jgi:large subunit ribosomal protein L31e
MASIEENLTRVYTINLGKAWLTPQYRRTDRVINMIKEFAQKHMKSEEIKLDQDLNREVWAKGKTNPPRKLRVKLVKDEDSVVTVSLYEDLQEAGSEKIDREAATSSENENEKATAPAATEQRSKA